MPFSYDRYNTCLNSLNYFIYHYLRMHKFMRAMERTKCKYWAPISTVSAIIILKKNITLDFLLSSIFLNFLLSLYFLHFVHLFHFFFKFTPAPRGPPDLTPILFTISGYYMENIEAAFRSVHTKKINDSEARTFSFSFLLFY